MLQWGNPMHCIHPNQKLFDTTIRANIGDSKTDSSVGPIITIQTVNYATLYITFEFG